MAARAAFQSGPPFHPGNPCPVTRGVPTYMPLALPLWHAGRLMPTPQFHPNDETARSYHGWRVVGACFVMAVLSWGFGFYGHGFYLAELQRLHGSRPR